jgi:hypothetical protein
LRRDPEPDKPDGWVRVINKDDGKQDFCSLSPNSPWH